MASTIATIVLHSLGLGWAIVSWQQRGATASPAPIKVLAVSPAATSALAASPPAATESQPPEVGAAVTTAPQNTVSAPAAPIPDDTPIAPAPSSPSTPVPAASPVVPSPRRVEEPFNPAIPAPEPAPDPSPEPRPDPEPRPQEDVAPLPASELPSGLEASWSLRVVPQGSDLPDQLPEFSAQWRSLATALLEESACFEPRLFASQVTVRLTVETDGRISEVASWHPRGRAVDDNTLQCLTETLSRPELPPLIPAMTGGEPIPTDMVLLTVGDRPQ